VIEALAPVFLGGLLALAGAAIGPFFQRRHEKWKANREDEQLMRDNALELFEELGRIRDGTRESTSASLKQVTDSEAEVVAIPEIGRVRAIATIYFSNICPLLDEYELKKKALQDEYMQNFDELAKRLVANRKTPEEMRHESRMLGAYYATAHAVELDKLSKEIGDKIGGEVPKIR
jgi:hypothetical protein